MKKSVFLPLAAFMALYLGSNKSASAQADSAIFNYADSAHFWKWTVPSCIDTIRITAFGAQGGTIDSASSPTIGGLGAEMNGTFTITPGDTLKVVTGRMGYSTVQTGSGGGGGSGVVMGSNPLIIAGGGGGRNSGGYAGAAGDTGQSGKPGINGSNAPGGSGGNKGDSVSYGSLSIAYGGSGFKQGNSGSFGINGYTTYNTDTTFGSWGLGGGGGGVGNSYCNCGGGGGGYSGGGAGGINGDGGGGGSYNAGANKVDFPGVRSGNGKVVIHWNVTVPAPLKDSVITVKNITCFGDSNASIAAKVSGGMAPYTYKWLPSGGTKDTASGLRAGSYTVTVTDVCKDSVMAFVSVTQPSAIVLSDSAKPDNGTCKGWAKVIASGGTGQLSYSWNGGGTHDTISNRCAGNFTCTVTDSNGCSKTIVVTITSTAGITAIAGHQGISIFPNPTGGEITITGTKNGDLIEIYNSLGQLLETKSAGGTATQLNIAGRANGMYLLRIITQDGKLLGEQQLLKQ